MPRQGFSHYSPERRQEIARNGGLKANRRPRACWFTKETAAAAGRKGGAVMKARREARGKV